MPSAAMSLLGFSGSCLPILLLVCAPAAQLGWSVMIVRNHMSRHRSGRPVLRTNQSGCALFVGSWVRDQVSPPYQPSQCPVVDARFDCQRFGRPDSDYLRYRWQPLNCNLPRFDGAEFLGLLRGKTVMFVGDSLGRNQWESLICMILASVPDSEMQLMRGDPLSTFRFPYYSVTISCYKAPYLVDIDAVQGQRVLKLEEISVNGGAWVGADVLLFNTGHWWAHTGSLRGWDFIEYGGKSYPDMDRLEALEAALTTWASWVDSNIDRSTTRVFFSSVSPTHDLLVDQSGEAVALAGKNCYGVTEPLTDEESREEAYTGAFSEQTKVVYKVMSRMRKAPYFMDITALSELRKDAHPSIYSGDLSPGQKENPDRSADCSHWCLPGLPDTWNQLFYAALLS